MRNASLAHRGGVLDAEDGGRSRRPLWASSVLIAALVLFCIFTHWGDTYTEFAINAWKALKVSRAYPMERRREALYGDTYDLLRSLCEATAPDFTNLNDPGNRQAPEKRAVGLSPVTVRSNLTVNGEN